MKNLQKMIAFLLMIAFVGQAGFAIQVTRPPNVALGDQQDIFCRVSNDDIQGMSEIRGITYYPLEDAVYIRRGSDLEEVENIAVSRPGKIFEERPVFQGGYVYDFEVDDGNGYLLTPVMERTKEPGLYLKDAAGNGVVIVVEAPNRREFEVCGDQFATIGLPFMIEGNDSKNIDTEQYQFATLPEVFPEISRDPVMNEPVMFDRVLAFDFVYPDVFDFLAGGEKIAAAGRANQSDQIFSMERMPINEQAYIEILTVPTESNVKPPIFGSFDELERPIPIEEGFHFEVTIDQYEDKDQSLRIRDMYATEDYIVVLVNEYNERRAFIQRYTYKGELVDQLETNSETWNITQGPKESTLYLQNRYMEESDREFEVKLLGTYLPDVQLEIIQMNWDSGKADGMEGRIKPVIAERTFKGRTIARFVNNGFGLIKQVEEETGIIDYRAPLKAQTNDVRLQIPYADLMAKSGMGARDLVLTYQGQNIAIPFDVLLSADVNEMPCQDDATIEIHLQMDEEGNVSYTIELFVVEQVNAMTKLVHRKTIQ